VRANGIREGPSGRHSRRDQKEFRERESTLPIRSHYREAIERVGDRDFDREEALA